MTSSQAVKQRPTVMSNEEKFKDSIDKAKAIASKMKDRIAAAAFLKNVDYLVNIGDPQIIWFVKARQIALDNEGKSTPKVDDADHYSF